MLTSVLLGQRIHEHASVLEASGLLPVFYVKVVLGSCGHAFLHALFALGNWTLFYELLSLDFRPSVRDCRMLHW